MCSGLMRKVVRLCRLCTSDANGLRRTNGGVSQYGFDDGPHKQGIYHSKYVIISNGFMNMREIIYFNLFSSFVSIIVKTSLIHLLVFGILVSLIP